LPDRALAEIYEKELPDEEYEDEEVEDVNFTANLFSFFDPFVLGG
jgi:hypothetical protein